MEQPSVGEEEAERIDDENPGFSALAETWPKWPELRP
jgi:hypothetical protein